MEYWGFGLLFYFLWVKLGPETAFMLIWNG